MSEIWIAALVVGVAISAMLGIVTFLTRVLAARTGPFAKKWRANYKMDGVDIEEELELSALPFSTFVWGSSKCHWNISNIRHDAEYKIRGLNRGKMLCGAYLTDDSTNHEVGVFIIRQSDDGKTAEGTITSYEKGDKKGLDRKALQPVPYHWTRA